MLIESVRSDFRIGLRVLVKERAFCALAIIVLALGICGVTTMFSVVNGVMLRGFSFPNADRLVSVNFIDPSSTNFFGVNGQVSAMDFEELRPAQQSFELLAAYLNGSTVNVTVDGTPQRYTGAYITEDFLRALGVAPDHGPRLHGRRQPARRREGGPHRPRHLAARFRRSSRTSSASASGSTARGHHRRRDAAGLRLPGQRGAVDPALQRVPAASAQRIPRNVNPAVLGLLEARRVASIRRTRSSPASPSGSPRRTRTTNKQFNTAQVEPLIKTFTPLPLRGTLLTMLGFCVGVLLIACVNVMNMQFARATLRAKELAIRSSLGATRAAPDPADAHREPAGRRHRRRARDRTRLPRGGLAATDRARTSTTRRRRGSVRHRRAGARLHRGRHARSRPWCPGCCRPGCRRARTRSMP